MPIAALIVGICSLLAAIIGGALGVSNLIASVILIVAAIIGGVVGIILSAMTMKKFPEKKGMGIGGLITSIVGLVYGIITLIACIACIGVLGAAVGSAAKDSIDSLSPEEKQQIEQGINQAINEINTTSVE